MANKWLTWCRSALYVWAASLLAGARLGGAAEITADFHSQSPAVRRHAAEAAGRLARRDVLPEVIAALGDPDKSVRREAAKALGLIKDGRAVPGLLAALGDSDTNVRFYAAHALGEIKDCRAATRLLAAMDDPQWCVRDQAAWALRELRDPQIVPRLTQSLADSNADFPHVLWLLQQLDPHAAIRSLATLLQQPQPAIRLRAVQALAATGGPLVVPPLVEALADADPAVRRIAVQALVKIGDPRAEEPAAQLLARETDDAIRESLEKYLDQLSGAASLAAHWSFDDRSPQVAADVTGNGNDGQIKGCEPVEGRAGYALRFGRGHYVELGKVPNLPLANKPITIMAWIKPEADRGVIVARGGAFCGYSLYLLDGMPRFGIRRDRQGPICIAAADRPLAAGWAHLAGVIAKDRIELYVNGKLAGAAKSPGLMSGNCGQGMEIGFDAGNSAVEIVDAFEGIIDEVKVFYAALGEREIAKHCR